MKHTSKVDQCPLCGGEKEPGRITFSADLTETVLVVKNVPATVCGLCGNEWLSKDVMGSLEKLADQAKQKHKEVELFQYPQSA